MYAINEPIDKNIVTADRAGLRRLRASLIRTGVSNYFNNIDDLFSAVNGLLQGKLDKAGNDMGRVMINTIFGHPAG